MKKMRKPLRNPAACNPLLRKAGPHQPAKLATRPRLDRRDALADYEDWYEEDDNNEGPEGPSSFFRAATQWATMAAASCPSAESGNDFP